MKLRRLALTSSIVLSALALGACGGSGSSTSDSGPTLADFCPSYQDLQAKTNALQAASGADLAGRKKALSNFVDALDSLASDSPAEIQKDVQASADWTRGAYDAVKDAKSDKQLAAEGNKYTQDNPQPTTETQSSDKFASAHCDGAKPAKASGN